jgi:hypothetical protein
MENKIFFTILLCNEKYEDETSTGCGDPYSATRYKSQEQAQQQINTMQYPNAAIIDFSVED